jgi:hypothetical protein
MKKGSKMSKESIEKIKAKRKLQVITDEHKKKISKSLMGHSGYWTGKNRPPISEESRRRYSLSKIGNKNPSYMKKYTQEERKKLQNGHSITYQRILDEIREFEKQGYKCVPTDHRVRPDFIAVKNDKIYAVEVEYGKPRYSKYHDQEIMKYIDDVIWLVRKSKNS